MDLLDRRYVGPDGRTDTGLAKHSGCPVTKGQKKMITTMWFRKGVSAANPWSRYDPSGVLSSPPKKWRAADGAPGGFDVGFPAEEGSC